MMRTEQPLATFLDRHTVVYERTYPHEIRRVWDAVSTAEHLNAWMLPEVRVERRLGGSYAFGWGGPCDVPEATHGTLTVYDPPSAIQYTTTDGSFMRFDLVAVGDDTRLRFTLHFLPPADNAPVPDDPGGDLPAGTDTAWRPGFLVGYHHMLGRLDPFLRGEWTRDDNDRDLARFVADGWDQADLELMDMYRTLVRETCPPDAFMRDLARFDDRWTMRHTRTYPHPIERVWEAITTTEHLNRWLLPHVTVDAVDGGRCTFTWGGPRGSEQVGVVREVSPPNGIVYDLDTSYLRFELEAVSPGSTRLAFVHGFAPGAHVEPVDRPDGDQPAGPDSPWRPDFSQGFHVMLDALGILLASPPAAGENVLTWLARTRQDTDDVVARRTRAYRELIAQRCPPA